MLDRLDTLSDIDGKLRHLRIISDLLDGDKYKTVKYGQYYTILHLKNLLKQAETINDGPEALAQFKKLAAFVEPLGIESYVLTKKIHECIYLKRFNKLVVEQGWDLSKIESLISLVTKVIQPYKEADIALPATMKAFVFETWFRTKIDGGEDIVASESTKKIIQMTVEASKAEPYDPAK